MLQYIRNLKKPEGFNLKYTYYRQPEYFGDFHCIGNACQDNCCWGWRIDWKNEEIDKLKTAPGCSEELRELIEGSFTPIEDKEGMCNIKFDEQKKCPLLSEEGLCRIQKELGVEYMSYTCMVYPRKYYAAEPVVYRTCVSSCREVMRHLVNDERSMDLINVQPRQSETLNVKEDSKSNLAEHPEFKYRGELFEFFYGLIADKKHDIETDIILGALAAQTLTKLVESGKADEIPEALKSLKAQTHNGAQLKTIENIKPNYHLRFGFIGKVLRETVNYSFINTLNDQSGTPNIIYYNTASQRLNEIFKDRPFYLRNIALNLLFEFTVPFNFKDKTIFENYSLFALVFACIKLNMIALAINNKGGVDLNLYGKKIHYNGEDKFVGLTSMICRSLCQNTDRQKFLLKLLEDYKFTSPAYLALLVK